MNYRTVPYLYIALLLVLLAPGGVSAITADDDPSSFRESLHPNYPARISQGEIVIPSISDDASLAAKALTFEEVLISETVGPANFTQDGADAAALTGGRMAAVWEDNRPGPTAIFLQLYDASGNALGANQSLIFGDSYNLTDPHICADASGNFYVVWREDVNGFLQAARYDSLATPLTDVFFISDTIFASYAGEFDAACLPDGQLVVTWENYTIGNDIAYRIFDTDGTPSTALMTANSDGPFSKHWSPTVTAGLSGDFAIAWEDYRSGTADIFFRFFSLIGTPYLSEFAVSDAAARDSARYLPSMAYSSIEGYVVGWVDLRDGQNIYAQRISGAGTLSGANILLSDETASVGNWEIDLTISNSGLLLAAWTVYGSQNSIVLQRFSSGVVKAGALYTVSDADQRTRFMPAVVGGAAGASMVFWTDLINGSVDVLGAAFSAAGNETGPDFTVNDDALGAPSIQPVVTTFERYEWDIVFTDMRRDAGDIMLQRVYVGGDLIDANRRINTDQAGGFQSQPAVATNNAFLCISWTDVRSNGINGQNILCRFSRPNYDLSDEIVVNDDYAGSAAHYASACAMAPNGTTLVVWTDTRGGNAKIYGQLFDVDFNPIGGNFPVGPDAAARTGELARVSVDASGNFIVAYLDRLASGGAAAEFCRVDQAGAVTELFAFQSDQTGYTVDGFDAGISATDDIFLVWHAFSAGGNDIFLTVFNQAGSVTTATASIIDDPDADPDIPDMSIDEDGYLLVIWLDYRTGSATPFRQIFEPTLSPVQGNTPTYTTTGPYAQQPVTAGANGRGIFVWSDARADGLNVYASQELYSPTDVDDDTPVPTAFALEQNRPNPFNPTTTIQFSLASSGPVRLEVLNLLGQRVRLLADGAYTAGTHSIVWDGRDDAGSAAASGIYFYRLTSESFSGTRKMVLLK